MKKYLTITLFIVVLGIGFYFNINSPKTADENEIIIKVYADSLQGYRYILDNLAKYQEYEIQSNGKFINPEIILEDETGNLISIAEIIENKTLILRFKESNCLDCMEKYFFHLKGLINTKDIKSLILIGNFSIKQNMQVFNHIFEVKWDVYNYNGEFGFPIEKLDLPYFFVINESLFANNFRIALGTSSSIIESYLNGITEVLF